MRILIIGPIKDDYKIIKDNYDLIIGVDKGVLRAKENNILLDVAIGDFDSLGIQNKELLEDIPELVEFDSIKDESDFECALNYLSLKDNIDQIDCIGFLYGNRIDHLYENILLLNKFSNLNIKLISNKSKIYLLNKGSYEIAKDEYKYISFFAIKKAIISLKNGFKYQVQNDEISPLTLKYLSNEIIKEKASIETSDNIIVMQCND